MHELPLALTLSPFSLSSKELEWRLLNAETLWGIPDGSKIVVFSQSVFYINTCDLIVSRFPS